MPIFNMLSPFKVSKIKFQAKFKVSIAIFTILK